MSDNEPVTRVSEPLRPPRKRPVLVRLVGRWLLSLIILGLISGAVIAWGWFNFTAPGPLTIKQVVRLPKNAERPDIAAALQSAGVVSSAGIFSGAAALAERLRGAKLKPGEYEFPAGATMDDVLTMLTRGQFMTYKVTIPEGWTSQMVVNRLSDQEAMEGTLAKVPDEGSILPETYIVTRGYPREKLLAEMLAAQTKFLDQEMQRLSPDSPLKSRQDVVTLASVVEKETGVAEERPQVAAVFLNRLRQHMRLQSDPTVIYGIAGGTGKLDHPLTHDELIESSPYNTYTNDGLPEGPIANPGKAAIEAVLNPANVQYIYFVANGTGGHAFASTLEEHNANVKRWRTLNGQVEPVAPAATAVVPTITPKVGAAAGAASLVPPASAPIAPPPAPKKVPVPIFKKPKA